MPHEARIWTDTGLYHVTARGNGGQRIFTCVSDRELFLDLFDPTVAKHRWELYAWCLMGTHFHIVARVDVPEALARGMQWLKGVYAMRFNRRHFRRGHLFERPYATWPIRSEEHLYRAIAYTHRNPVAAGLTGRAIDWEWSSARLFAGLEGPQRPRLACRAGIALYQDPRVAALIDTIADDLPGLGAAPAALAS